jgi:hypothetical protein
MADGDALTSNVLNLSGLLYSKSDESTPLLDAIYSRGRAGGRRIVDAEEFVLANSYVLPAPEQPEISEQESLTAPDPTFVERVQETNVTQIFHKSVSVSYRKENTVNTLSGINVAGQTNTVPNELAWQISQIMKQMKADINYTLINGVYQYTRGSSTVAAKTRGLLAGITTNKVTASGAAPDKDLINQTLNTAMANGMDAGGLELWVNPKMIQTITDGFLPITGSQLPPSRNEGGVSYQQIYTDFGLYPVVWDRSIPDKVILILNVGQLAIVENTAVAQKMGFGSDLRGMGSAIFYEPLAKTGASDKGQLYGELGIDYGAEWMSAFIDLR